MSGMDLSGLEALNDRFDQLAKEVPAMRREYHEALGSIMEQELHASIDRSINDEEGKIKRFQVKQLGTGGGYALLRPAGSREGEAVGDNSPGAITNYLEGGHAIPKPGKSKNYRPRIRMARVPAFHLYRNARQAVEARAIQLANELADTIAQEIGG